MRVLPGFLVGFFVLGFVANASNWKLDTVKAKVTRVVDGDTIGVVLDGTTKEERIRFLGCDTPEKFAEKTSNQFYHAQKATKYVDSLIDVDDTVDLKIIRLEDGSIKRDKYFRILAWIYIGSTNVNLSLVEKGYAVPYLYCDKEVCADGQYKKFVDEHEVKRYLDACHRATKRRLGIHTENSDPVKGRLKEAPVEFRRHDREVKARKRQVKNGKPPEAVELTSYHIGNFFTEELTEKGMPNYQVATIGVDFCDRVQFDRLDDAKGFKTVKKAPALPVKPTLLLPAPGVPKEPVPEPVPLPMEE